MDVVPCQLMTSIPENMNFQLSYTLAAVIGYGVHYVQCEFQAISYSTCIK